MRTHSRARKRAAVGGRPGREPGEPGVSQRRVAEIVDGPTAMTEATSIHALLARGGRDDIAIAAPERAPLTYGGLRDQVARTGEALGEAGVRAGDRVAIVLPNGPEMATAFLGVAAHATAAPLNPAYRADEFAFYLDDLGAKALILEDGAEGPVVEAAQRVGVPIIGLTPERGAAAGCFSLDIPADAGAAEGDGDRGDAALVLHTSGTTSRPKIVPLTGANLCASARSISGWLALEPGERCLNIMPLFHIHGLMAGVMASLGRGQHRDLHAGLQRAPLLRLAGRDGAHLGHRRAHHAPGDPRAQPPKPGGHRRAQAAPAALLLLLAAGAGDGRAGVGVRRAGDRILWHDRGLPPDDQQSAAAGRAQAGRGGVRRRAASRDHGRGRPAARSGRKGRGGDTRRERHPRLREQPGGQRGGVLGRLVPHRRPGGDRRGRSSDPHRPAEGGSSTAAARRSRPARWTTC